MPIKVFIVNEQNIIRNAVKQLQKNDVEIIRLNGMSDIYDCYDEIFDSDTNVIILDSGEKNLCDENNFFETSEDYYLKNNVNDENNSLENKLIDLTNREIEVLKLVARGLLNKEIAERLYISERTVKNHISRIFKKIEVMDRTQAAVFAIKNKLIDV